MPKNLKKIKSIIPAVIVLSFLFSFLFLPLLIRSSFAASPNPVYFTPQIEIPNSDIKGTNIVVSGDLIGKYIEAIYNYGLTIGAILAAIVLMLAGIIWLTSAGSQEKVGQAKKMFAGSIIGLLILFSSYLILNTINPDLTKISTISYQGIENLTDSGPKFCCEISSDAIMASEKECEKFKGKIFIDTDGYSFTPVLKNCLKNELFCNIKKDCDDRTLWCYDSEKKEVAQQKCGDRHNVIYKDEYVVKSGKCSAISECSTNSISCNGVPNGSKCPKQDNETNPYSLCYCENNKVFFGYGAEFEPCGTKDGAYCSKIKCSEITGEKKYYRQSNGRMCGTFPDGSNGRINKNLQCCYPE